MYIKEKVTLRPAPLSNKSDFVNHRLLEIASSMGHTTASNVHLFLALVEEGALDEVLKDLQIDSRTFLGKAEERIHSVMGHDDYEDHKKPRVEVVVQNFKLIRTIEDARLEAALQGSLETEPHHLLVGTLKDKDGFLSAAFEGLDINQDALLEATLKRQRKMKAQASPPIKTSPTSPFQKLGIIFRKS